MPHLPTYLHPFYFSIYIFVTFIQGANFANLFDIEHVK